MGEAVHLVSTDLFPRFLAMLSPNIGSRTPKNEFSSSKQQERPWMRLVYLKCRLLLVSEHPVLERPSSYHGMPLLPVRIS